MKRNLIIRTITGTAFVAVMVFCILWHPLSYAILFAIISALTTWEFCTIVNRRMNCQTNRVVTTVASVYLFAAILAFNANICGSEIFIPYLLTLVYLLISELYLKENNTLLNWAFTMMSQLYIALPFALLNTLSFVSAGTTYGMPEAIYTPVYTLSLFIFLWVGDSAAYCFGSWLGRHRLFPRISPKKSWEGCIGAFVTAVAVSQLVAVYQPIIPTDDPLTNHLVWAGLAATVTIFGTWGDLVESQLKRKLGIKDSGNILPGHGGMLDRFDSSLIAIPMAVLYIYTINEFMMK
ncbi:MAG: phosphatidate cytidylyltransferase [Bacteroidaceae bacterium]|nr:phosphatidate cytidylyltransferase [Bacteroidaceae bacterium]